MYAVRCLLLLLPNLWKFWADLRNHESPYGWQENEGQMDSFIPTLLQYTANLMSTISVFGSQIYPSSPLACSRAVATVTSHSDNGCVSARMEEALGCSCAELLRWGRFVHQSETSGVNGSLSEVEAHHWRLFFLSHSTQSVLTWLRFAEVLIYSSMSVCSV